MRLKNGMPIAISKPSLNPIKLLTLFIRKLKLGNSKGDQLVDI
jgi:hypothetical protein